MPSGTAVWAATAVCVPFLGLATVLVGVATVAAPPSQVRVCGGVTQVGDTVLDAEQVANASTIVGVVAGRRLPRVAAVTAVTVAYTESRLHNSSTQTDHDSEGLFQQRIALYTAAVADDPVPSTNAFLDRLTRIPGWTSAPIDLLAQQVQVSSYPQRYATNIDVAGQLVGTLWPTTTAATATATRRCPPSASTVGDAMTTMPTGLVIDGGTRAQVAVRYALAQLYKPYLFGAAGPDAFDCSGLTMAAWAAAGIALPHWTVTQAAIGTPEPPDLSQAVSGDLVFVPGADGTPTAPGHVAMVVGHLDRPDGRHLLLIQAPTDGIPVDLVDAATFAGQVVAVRHLDTGDRA